MSDLQTKTLIFLMLLATGSCFVSALIDGPLKAAFSLLGGQRRAAPVSQRTAPQIPAQVPPAEVGSTPNALSSQGVPNVRPIYESAKTSNDYGWNTVRPTVIPCEDCNWTVEQNDEECKGDCNRHQTVKTYPGDWHTGQIVSIEPLKNGVWSNGRIESSQMINSWIVHRPNVKSIGEQEDWTDISDNIENHMYGTQVKPIVGRLPVPVRGNAGDASDVFVITQPGKPISIQISESPRVPPL